MAGFSAGEEPLKNEETAAGRPETRIDERDSVRFIRASMKNGRRICIKYPLEPQAGPACHWRRWLAAASGQAFLRSLPPLPPQEKNLLEVAKLRAFRAAGLAVPDILAVQSGFSIFADAGKNIADILAELIGRDAALHDGLLVSMAAALGQIHAAGLCLGRPDLRDMFLAAHGVGFSGFADYPEQSMPAAAAQLRDIWLLLELIADKAADKDKALAQAFFSWRRQAGLETLEALRQSVRFFRRFLRPYKVLSPIFFSRARQKRLLVLQFLIANVGV